MAKLRKWGLEKVWMPLGTGSGELKGDSMSIWRTNRKAVSLLITRARTAHFSRAKAVNILTGRKLQKSMKKWKLPANSPVSVVIANFKTS